ncbi:MAG: DUF4340 domain-containing protein [Aquimonas sp.]|nr:DUF4340 domain-containing protein [Aquimonas sp.]
MIKQKHLLGLAAAAVVLLLLAVALSESRRPAQEAVIEGPLLAGLEQALNSVERVEVLAADGEPITLLREGDRWQVREQHGYAANFGTLRELLLNLAQARRIEPRTANPGSYALLGVQDIDAEGATGVELRIQADSSDWRVILGQNNPRGVGTFVRVPGEAQSWLADRNLAAERSLQGWLQRELLDIAANRVASVVVQPAEGDEVRIEAAGGEGPGDFRLVNLPQGREAASEFVADATAGFLSGLRIDDVALAEGWSPAEDAPRTQARFELREGLNVDVEVFGNANQAWGRFAVSLDEEVATRRAEGEQAREAMAHENAVRRAREAAGLDADSGEPIEGAESALAAELPAPPLAVTDPEADRMARVIAAREEAERLQQAVDGWVFQLPAFKVGNLVRSMDAYLKPQG